MKVGTAVPSLPVTRSEHSRWNEVDFDHLTFGKEFSDHMFVAEYRDGAWHDARIEPFAPLPMHPATSGIHYGQCIFEGMKAYRDGDGVNRFFRPDRNVTRFNRSADRMAMPEVPVDLFFQALHELVRVDADWVPDRRGSSLYIRPFMYATDRFIGIKIADTYRFMIITSPAGVYYPKPVRVLVAKHYVRAFEGGTGFAKAAGNYGAVMQPLHKARKLGYDQMLWLDGKEFRYAQEIGTMNVFFVFKDGRVVTPSTDRGTILEGVTRESVIDLLRENGNRVEERRIGMDEVMDVYDSGDLVEIFGTGTAATIAQIAEMGYQDREIAFEPSRWTLSDRIKEVLEDIRYGRVPDRFGWMVEV